MTTLDLGAGQDADHRETLFETLDTADIGDSITLRTSDDPSVLLTHYQIKHGYELQWDADVADGDEGQVRVTKGEPVPESELAAFDVRDMPPQQRHEVLTDTFDRLDPGEGFVLVNDHDPKPLYHELRSTRGDGFDWEYSDRESQEWRVAIVKTEPMDPKPDDVVASFDVREIPKKERHPTIHHRYSNIGDGETMEIIAPHEPKPLHREFQQRYGGSFTWDVVESEPGRCRVKITKADADGSENADRTTTPTASDALEITRELDVRDLPPAQRHEQIFDAYDALELGEGFVLVNDHDPKPLYHQFEAEAGDEFTWEYRQQEPGEFRVLIAKDETDDEESESTRGSEPPF